MPGVPAGEPSSPEPSASQRSAPTSSIYALVAALYRLCGLLEIQNEKTAQLIGLLVTIEPVAEEDDEDEGLPTHDLSGRPIRTS